ncbi:MAG: DUF2974 domain-containing protein [Spirochaetaceae bacterium]|jgi:hypothetical protein|nr:DUF2974 domain-containing protein [Spirochaetaceae bacterium]
MSTVFDYLEWRGDLPFAAAPFNPVDNIIFSLLSYCPFDNLVPPPGGKTVPLKDAIEGLLVTVKKNPKKMNMYHFFKDAQYKLLLAVIESKRFCGIDVCGYVNHFDKQVETQFSALTFVPRDSAPAYIAFRGTDGTIIGWKEDFNMTFTDTIPAQEEALLYTEKMSKHIKGGFYIGGHSKGGNLAVYAGAFCAKSIKKRIITIFNNDGPGFPQKTAHRPEYIEVKDKIISYIPRDSVIGLLFEDRAFCVLKSGDSGFMQHNPFLWEVTKNDVQKIDTITEGSRFVNKTLTDWLESMDNEKRRKFISALFEVLMSTNANSIPDLTSDWLKSARLMITHLSQSDKETKTMLAQAFGGLFEAAKNNFFKNIEKIHTKAPQKNDTV